MISDNPVVVTTKEKRFLCIEVKIGEDIYNVPIVKFLNFLKANNITDSIKEENQQ